MNFCAYCGSPATLHASGNPAWAVPPHNLCNSCNRKAAYGQLDPRKWWNPPAPASQPSPPASWKFQSQAPSSYQAPSQIPSTSGNYIQRIQVQFGNPTASPSVSQPIRFLKTEKVAGPVIGYRAWTVKDDRLVGFMAGSQLGPWSAEAKPTSCVNGSHMEPPPSADCGCGYHAWKDLAMVEGQPSDGIAVGAVQLWGKLIEHGEEGWRAKYAKPLVLLAPVSKALREHYGVAVVETPEALEMMAGELAK